MAVTGKKKHAHRDARHESFLKHKGYRYAKVATFLSVIAIVGYFLADVSPRPNGGTWYGYTLGTIGALLIIWLTLLGLRKRAITPGFWSLKAWTSAHVYLGLSLTVIATLHTGFQFGWNIHTLAYVLMMVVIISGLFGIYFYGTLPRAMSDNRAENSQAEMMQSINALNGLLAEAAQPLEAQYVHEIQRALDKTKVTGGLFSRLSGKVSNCATERALRKMRAALETASPSDRDNLENVISVLERKSITLNRARRHIRYKTLLELWLYFHVPFTFALLAALTAHIISVFFYW